MSFGDLERVPPPESWDQRLIEKRWEIGWEWLKWTLAFAGFVLFAWGFSNTGLIEWLDSTLNFFDPAGPYGFFKKWMLLLGLYVLAFAGKVVGMVRFKD